MNQRGVSVLETLLALGILAIVALGVSESTRNMNSDLKKVEVLNDMNILHRRISHALTTRGICTRTFQALPLATNPPVPAILDVSGNAFFATGSTYEKTISIDSMQVTNYLVAPVVPTEDSFELAVTYSVNNESAYKLNHTATKNIKVNIKTVAGVFDSCFTGGDVGTDDEYIRHLGSDTRTGDTNIEGFLEVKVNTSNGSGGYVIAEEFYQTSDVNLKKEITALAAPFRLLRNIQGYSYRRIATGRQEYGFIAQELEAFSPLVKTNPSGYKAVKYSNIIPLLVEGSKTLKNRQTRLHRDLAKERRRLSSIERALQE